MRTEARFPTVSHDAGHYESFYLKAADPECARSIWIRHTVHKRPGREPTCAVWATYFDAAGGPPRAAKQQYGSEELDDPEGAYLSVSGSEIGPGWARGSVAAGPFEASWDLRFTDHHEPLRHLPSEWMYRRPLPRTKLLSPHPGASFDGTLEIAGERVDVSGWPGMVGHNWGAEHAEQWLWIHAAAPEGGAPGDYLDIAAGRIRIGPLTTPWIANGALAVGGEVHRLGGIGAVRRTELGAEATGCRFVIPGSHVLVRGSVGAAREQFVGFVYSDPAGGSHDALNCSISDLEVRVERPGRNHLRLACVGGAVYELGTHDPSHGIPIQPFADG